MGGEGDCDGDCDCDNGPAPVTPSEPRTMGAGRVGRPGRPAELIGGQCRDNTPIVEDKGGCVPLELDTREAVEAETQLRLSHVLYYIWKYCVV